MAPVWIILITIVGVLVLGVGGAWLWNKFAKGKNIIPVADLLLMAAKFFVKQFDFIEQDLVIAVLNYVQEAYHAIQNISELTTLQARVDAALAKAYEICEREGLDLEAYPQLIDLIETAVRIVVTFWANSSDEVTTVDVKEIY